MIRLFSSQQFANTSSPEACDGGCRVVRTWLILPVVICLSQRLSHACLRVSIFPRSCEWLIKTVIVYAVVSYYMNNYTNCRANACVKSPLLYEGVFLLGTETFTGPRPDL